MRKKTDKSELNLERLYGTMVQYKWFIAMVTLLVTILMFIHLYFTPSTYSSSTIMEIKSKESMPAPKDFLLNTFAFKNGREIDKAMEMLKTFPINNKVLQKVDFQTSYYALKNYRKIELYDKSPIHISNLELLNDKLIGQEIKLSPVKGGFTLEIENSLIDKLLNLLSFEPLLELDQDRVYPYNQEIHTDYFRGIINNTTAVKEPLYIVFHGDNRTIFNKILSKNLEVTQVNQNTPLVQIAYTDTLPRRAKDYLNAIVQSFIDQSIMEKNEHNNQIVMFINQQLDSIKGTLKRSEDTLENYKIANQAIKTPIEAENYIRKLSNLEIELSENELQQKLVTNLINFTLRNKMLDTLAPSLMELNDQPSLQLINTLQRLQLEEESLGEELTEHHPKLISIRKQIYMIRQKILSNIKNLKTIIVQKGISLKQEKKKYENKIKDLPTKEKKLVNIQRNYTVSSSMYNYLLKKKTETEMIMVATPSDYRVIDKASTNIVPIKPKRILMVVVALVIGLLLGIIGAVIRKGVESKVSGKEDLEFLTDFPLYGIIPELKQRDVKLEVYDHPNSHFTESFRSLRDHLPLNNNSGIGNIVLVTSTIAGEGKTTVTANLASVCQMAGYKSIILNFDLRKPVLHDYFNLSNDKGLSTYLSFKDKLEDIIVATKYIDLHVIVAGPVPSNPSELILSKRVPQLLETLKKEYDFIFIDSAPVGLVSETIRLMKYADLNLILVRENYAKKSFMDDLKTIIEKNRLENIGMVLNASMAKNKSSYYGYGYGYGYEKEAH